MTVTTALAPAGQPRPYLRLVISDAGYAKLYKKDFEVRHVFDTFVRRLVRDLLQDGTVQTGDMYVAVVIPHYEQAMRTHPRLLNDAAKAGELRDWLTLEFEEGVRPEQPLRFFTLEVRVRERGLVYQQDFSLRELRGFYSRIATSLFQLGVLQTGQVIRPAWFARCDAEADLDRDQVYALEAQANDLVEVMEDEAGDAAADAFPEMSLTDYDIEEIAGHAPPVGGVQILLARPALSAMQAIARNGATVEEGGVLVGSVFRQAGGDGYLVEIAAHLFSEKARGTEFELRYTFEAWQERSRELKERFPNARIVGWYHTHLVKQQSFNAENELLHETELFFSSADHFMHRQFFPDQWYVALVLNPAGEAAFFQWQAGQIVQAPGFFVYRP